MNITIFTPTHNSSRILEAYDSLKDQVFHEWIIGLNNGANRVPIEDPRVKQVDLGTVEPMVGMLKGLLCEMATGDILVELDHDDLLMPNALEEINNAFLDPEIGFVYSNTIRCTGDFKPTEVFSNVYGWEYRDSGFKGLLEYVSFAPEPSSVSRIWYAPDHVRAFRKSVYDAVGGYNKGMRVLDDQDLMARLYKVTKFHHIDKPLYIYRIDGENTYLKYNQEIQQNVMRIHDMYFDDMTGAWADREDLLKVELGGRMNAKQGYTTVDLRDAHINRDLNQKWPFEDNTVGVIRAFDVFEHLKDPIHTMKELYRVLAPGGYAIIQVPSTDGRGAFQDPTHVSFWNENSFKYYTDRFFNKYIDCPVRFQPVRLYTTAMNQDQVCWVVAHLRKLGEGRVPGECRI